VSRSFVVDTAIVVEIDGAETSGLLHGTITSNNYFSADSYSLTFATGPQPLRDISYWSTLSYACVNVLTKVSSGSSQISLIMGTIDSVYVDATRATVSIDGRDLSSSLVDSYRQVDFVNRTASEVVVAVASRHGLAPIVAPTSGSTGRYFGEGYTRLSTSLYSRLRSDWDVVVQLARENDFDVFVKGRTLYFVPATKIPLDIVTLTPDDIVDMRLERSLAVAPTATVKVQSWNCQNMAPHSGGASGEAGNLSTTAAGSESQPYLFSVPNLTSEQAAQAAASYVAEIGRLRTTLLLEMPWNIDMAPRTGAMLTKTGAPLDGLYRVESIERRYNSVAGSVQSVRAVPIVGLI
jgi:hypothetical protein